MTVDKKTDEAFLSRWARVKQDAQAKEQETSIGGPLEHKMVEDAHLEQTLPDAPVALPALDSLTLESDFSPFMAKEVDPQLRNLAMKKLFTDPHYNVMDRLDIYIDDYSTHPPLPLDVIRQMSISKTLGLFDDEEKEGAVAAEPSPLDASPAAVDAQLGRGLDEMPAGTETPAAAEMIPVENDKPIPREGNAAPRSTTD
jgi:hypothetical protein